MARAKFTARYVDELTSQLRLIYPTLEEEKLKGLVRIICRRKFKNPTVKIVNDNKNVKTMNLVQFIDYIETEVPILSGFGTLYRQHGDLSSLLYVLVNDLIKLRKDAKNEMFKHINDEDQTMRMMFNTMQLTYKLLNNSLYGATIEKSSFFYNPNFGPSVTYTGVVIITTSLNVFEKFMSNNFYFRHIGDLTTYVNNIRKEDYNPFSYVDSAIEKETLINYLFDKLQNGTEDDRLRIVSLVDGLSEENITKIYLKNNLYATIDNSVKLQELFKKILGNTDFMDPNEPPEEYLGTLNELWDIMNIMVHYDYLDFYRYENAEYGERKTILTVDTDSNFLYLYPFFDYCKKKFGLEDNDIIRMTTTNVIMYVLTALITQCYETLTKAFNIKDVSQRKIIQMKNEFYYNRIMLTNSKKNYSGIINLQEGKVLDPPKHDIKGLAIKKVSTNKEVRKFFTKLLKEDILESKEIEISTILQKYSGFEDRIRDSLKSGDITFAVPGKVNAIESYKEPYTQQTVRGSILWNALYPNKEIIFPDKINFVKLKDREYDEIMEMINSNPSLSDNDKNYFCEVITNTIFKDDKMAKYGFKILCMPKSQSKIPDWLVQFVDIDKIIEDNMKPGLKLLESLEFKMLSYQVGDEKGELASNIINI